MDDDVRAMRRARRMTQAQLATATGVSRQTVISVEGGDYAPSVYLAIRIATVAGHDRRRPLLRHHRDPRRCHKEQS